MENYSFKSVAFGGFDKQDVVRYLEQSSEKAASLQKELETENVSLTSQYQRMFDMASVKEAAEAAGMSKPSSTQMSHLDLSAGDSAVAYRQREPGLFRRILSSLHGGVCAVVEYFD